MELSARDATCNSSALISDPAISFETNSTRVYRWVRNAQTFIDCPEAIHTIVPRLAIPKVLHRIWECDELPARYDKPLDSWGQNATGMVVFLWTGQLREKFILKYLGSEKLTLYNRLVPGSYRADLFKYIVLHYIGGIYSDLDVTLLLNLEGLDQLFEGTTISIDLHPARLLPGAIVIAPPKQLVFVCAMGEVFDHSKKRMYFGSDASASLDVTGPGVLGECVRHILGEDDALFEPGVQELATVHFRFLRSSLRPSDGVHAVELYSGVQLVELQSGGVPYERQVSPACDPGEHYSTLYGSANVYRDDDSG